MASKAERIPVAKTYKIYIDGKFPRTESGRYFTLEDTNGKVLANVCRASRKDFRNAVVAARKAQPGWAGASAYNRGQVLYRIAEMLEGRRDQFVAELVLQGSTRSQAGNEVDAAIDRLIYFAGWSDKYQQVFSAVNPVASSHFNFSVLEPTGLVANLAPAIVGGNAAVTLASESKPLSAVSFAEVLHASDVPAGVVNILTGYREELSSHFASHMDVNALVCCEAGRKQRGEIQVLAAENLKRVVFRKGVEATELADPYAIRDTQEVKTTWHPVGK